MNTIWLSGQSALKSPKTFLWVRESRRIDWSRSAMVKKRRPALSRPRNAGLRIAAPALSFLPSYRPLIPASADLDRLTSLISNRGDNGRRSCLLGRPVSGYHAKNNGGNDR